MTPLLCVVGAANLDLVVEVARLPSPGDTVVGTSASCSSHGGKGANQAAAAAAYLGGRRQVALVGRVGRDKAGNAMLADLEACGVDIAAVQRGPELSGSATIAVDPHGENLIIVDPGANAALTPQAAQVAAVRDARVVLIQLEVPFDVVRAVIAQARGRIVLNPAPARGGHEFVPWADVLVPNRHELAELVGCMPAADVHEAVEQVRRLDAAGDVVVTLGGQGALVVTGDGAVTVVPAVEVTAVDTTGAGDCFCGVLAGLLAHDVDLVPAVHDAAAAASMSVTARGARGRLPVRDEVPRPSSRPVAVGLAKDASR